MAFLFGFENPDRARYTGKKEDSMELLDLRGPHDDIENVHTLLCSVATRKKLELDELISVHAKYAARSAKYKVRSLAELGWTAAEVEAAYEIRLERKKLAAEKAAKIAIAYYELYNDEIHEQAHSLNELFDKRKILYGEDIA
jgi:hypothetical protein